MSRVRRGGAAAAWALSAAVFARKLAVPLYDPDLWWHLAAGREMVRRGAWLRTDVFSHTLAGSPWIDFEWLAQLFLYGLQQAGGLWALYAGKILFSLTALGLLTWTLRRQGARGPVLLAGAWAGFLLLRPRLFDRTELATLNLLPLSILLALSARASLRWRERIPWALSGLMVLWVNLHGGFIYGLAALAAFAAGARWAGEEAGYVRSLDKSLAWCLAATLVNPYGPAIWRIFVDVFIQSRNGLSALDEWRPPFIGDLPVFWFFFLLGGGVLVRGILKGSRSARFWAPAIVGFAVLGGGHYRSAALFAFAVLPFLAGELAAPGPLLGKALWAAAGAAVCLNAGALVRRLPRAPVFKDMFPAGACRFVREHDIRGTLFNVYGQGGYLDWTLGPDRKVFIDGRYIFFPLFMDMGRLFEKAGAGEGGGETWDDFMGKHGVDYAVVPPLFPAAALPGRAPFPLRMTNLMFPRDRWALVYWDDAGLVFLKRGAGFDGLIAKHEYRWLWPYNLDQMRYAVGAGGLSRAAASAELDRHAVEAGPTDGEREMRGLLSAGFTGGS